MKYWDWEDTVCSMLAAVVATVVGTAVFAIWQDHSIQFYFLQDGGKTGTCVTGHRNWTSDSPAVFCSQDAQVAALVAKQFNEVIAAGKARK